MPPNKENEIDLTGVYSVTNAQNECAELSHESSDVPFRSLGHYEIVGRLGQGGMGDVYKAYERELDRHVAIKVLPPELSRSDEFVQRFRAEATAVAKVTHPNVVQIHFIGADAGHHFFAMEFVEGESLAELMQRKGSLAVDEVLAIAEQTLAGLSAVHERGIIHRDIKPANILLDHDNRRAVLADFGLVRSLTSRHGMTATGVVMGTVDYISPEQGRGADVDARVDLYSMGVLLYEMLSGDIPFHADSPTAMIFQHVYEQPKPLAKVDPGIPGSICEVVHKLLAKSPSDRYTTAEETLEALHRAVRSDAKRSRTQVIHAPKFESVTSLPEDLDNALSEPWWAALRAKIYTFLRRKTPEFVKRLENTQQQVNGAIIEYRDRHDKLQQLVGDAEGVASELRALIEDHRQAITEAERRQAQASDEAEIQDASEEIARCQTSVKELTAQLEEQSDEVETMRLRLAKVNATLQRLESQRDLLNVRLKVARAPLYVDSGARPSVLRSRIAAIAATASLLVIAALLAASFLGPSDSETPASLSITQSSGEQENNESTGLRVSLDAGNSQVIKLPGDAKCVSAAPPNQHTNIGFAVGFADGTINVFRIRREQIDTRADEKVNADVVTGHLKAVTCLAFSADGDFFASGSNDHTVAVWEARGAPNRAPLRRLQHETSVTAVAFSPDGGRVLTGTGSGESQETLHLWDVLTATKIKSFDLGDFRTAVKSIAWTNDGTHLLIGARAHGVDSMSLWSFAGESEEHVLSTNESPARAVALSTSEEEAYGLIDGEGIRAFDVATGELLRDFGAGTSRAAFSPTTDRVLASAGNEITIWGLRNGKIIERLEVPVADKIEHVALSSDGSFAMCIGDNNEMRVWKLKHAANPDGQLLAMRSSGPVVSIACFPNGANVLATGGDGVALWNIQEGTKNLDYGIKTNVTCVALTPDRKSLLYGTGSSRAGTVGLRDLASTDFRDRLQFLGHEGPITSVTSTADGRYVLSSSKDGTVRVWDAQDGQQVEKLDVKVAVNAIAVSKSSDAVLLACDDQTVRLWKWLGTGQIAEFTGHSSSVNSVVFLGNATQFASGAADGTICLWGTSSAQITNTLKGHRDTVNSLAFDQDRMRLLSAGDDEHVRLWDLQSGEALKSFLGHVGPVPCVRLLEPGRAISGGADGRIVVWELP